MLAAAAKCVDEMVLRGFVETGRQHGDMATLVLPEGCGKLWQSAAHSGERDEFSQSQDPLATSEIVYFRELFFVVHFRSCFLKAKSPL